MAHREQPAATNTDWSRRLDRYVQLVAWWALAICCGVVSFVTVGAASIVSFWVRSPSFHPAPSDPQPPFQTPRETLWLYAAAVAIGLFVLAYGYHRQADVERAEDGPRRQVRLLDVAATLISWTAGAVAVAAIALPGGLG